MPDLGPALWSLFVSGVIAVTVLLAAFAGAMVLAHREQAAMQARYTARILAAHDEERARIGRELHDDVLQRLAMLRFRLSATSDGGAEAAAASRPQSLADITAGLEKLSRDLRTLSQRIHPSVVDHLGLSAALYELVLGMGGMNHLRVAFQPPADPVTLGAESRIVAYRIAQEALHNVVRHSGAQQATVRLEEDYRGVQLSIQDDGRGFRPEDVGLGGLGITSMRERAVGVGAELVIRSARDEGTIVSVRFPRAGA